MGWDNNNCPRFSHHQGIHHITSLSLHSTTPPPPPLLNHPYHPSSTLLTPLHHSSLLLPPHINPPSLSRTGTTQKRHQSSHQIHHFTSSLQKKYPRSFVRINVGIHQEIRSFFPKPFHLRLPLPSPSLQ